jgi:hypothetical protein
LARPDRSPPRALRLPPTIDRADVPQVVERCRRRMPTEPGASVTCDAGDVIEPRLPTVETVARLALSAARNRQDFRLEHAGPDLLDLLAFCGLAMPVAPALGPEAEVEADVEVAAEVAPDDDPARRR